METEIETQEPLNGWVRVSLIILPFIFIVGLSQMVGSAVMGLSLSDFSFPRSPFQEMVMFSFGLLGTFIVVGFFRRFIDEESFLSMGFYSTHWLRESFVGLMLGGAILSAGFASLIILDEIQWTGTNFELSDLIWSACMFVSVAVAEELFFRGYILNNLMKSMSRVWALVASSVLFSLMHVLNSYYSWLSFVDLSLAGLLLGLTYIYTQRLWLPIALHFSWNFFQGTIFGFNVSGSSTYSVIIQSHTSDNFLNGGSFGFEGSVLSIVIQLVVILFICWFFSRRNGIAELKEAV